MREAERREQAALEYAKAVEKSRQELESRFKKTDLIILKRFEKNIDAGLEAAQRELAAAIEAGDAKGQIEANKRIAELAFENAKLKQAKTKQYQLNKNLLNLLIKVETYNNLNKMIHINA